MVYLRGGAKPMVIVYRISEEDFTEAQKLFMSGQKRLRRWARRLMPWEGGFSLIVGVAGFFTTRDRVVPTFLCLVGVYLLYCSFAIRRYFRRLYRTDQRYKHDIKAEVSEDGIHFETPFADSHMKWASVVRWLESEKVFILFHSLMQFSIIPKHAFKAEDIDAFRELLGRMAPKSDAPAVGR